jgi:hypothetical protein
MLGSQTTTDLAVLAEPSEQRPSPYEILRSMLVPTRQSVFVLGCLERRVTLLHQQVRALNLASLRSPPGSAGVAVAV